MKQKKRKKRKRINANLFNSDTHLKSVTNINMERTSETTVWKQESK